MTLQEAIIGILEDDPGVAANAPGGVDSPLRLPLASVFPALRFTTVSDSFVVVSDQRTDTQRLRIQLDAFAYSWGEAKALEAATVAALCPQPNVRRTVGDVIVDGILPDVGRDRYETTTGLYMVSRDFIAWGGLAS